MSYSHGMFSQPLSPGDHQLRYQQSRLRQLLQAAGASSGYIAEMAKRHEDAFNFGWFNQEHGHHCPLALEAWKLHKPRPDSLPSLLKEKLSAVEFWGQWETVQELWPEQPVGLVFGYHSDGCGDAIVHAQPSLLHEQHDYHCINHRSGGPFFVQQWVFFLDKLTERFRLDQT